MPPSNHPGRILPQDTSPGDGNEEVNVGQPVSLTEVEDLLYGDDRPAELRLDRLNELANELRDRVSSESVSPELDDNEARTMLDEIERAIYTLRTKSQFVGEPGMLDDDPLDHRETLAPDSDELEEIEEEDEASIEDDIGADESEPKPH